MNSPKGVVSMLFLLVSLCSLCDRLTCTGVEGSSLCVVIVSGDQTGECRAHGNLGSAFFSKSNYREALTNHRHQLVLAMKLKDREVGLPGSTSQCCY
ncbi:UNVERIFIED_CONTAM: hypothetical protein FKN15_039117 [Acipenser sinensis]